VTPVINPPRTIPAALRDRVKEELDDMEKRGVVRKVEEPTDWVNSMAIVEKPNGSLRICLDPRHLNKAIKREHFQLLLSTHRLGGTATTSLHSESHLPKKSSKSG